MLFDRKEQFLMNLYSGKIENHSFDEIDIIAFLILVREHLDDKYRYIKDIADLVAHRRRNQGIASDAISGAIANEYTLKTNSTSVRGYQGINTNIWKKELCMLGEEYGFSVNSQTVFEISLCVMSLLQYSTHEDKSGNRATIFLFQTSDRQLEACTLEDGRTQPYIIYFVLDDIDFADNAFMGIIKEPVIAIRNDNGELILRDKEGRRIV